MAADRSWQADLSPLRGGSLEADLALRDELVAALVSLGYEEPTPIQREAIPPLLAGRDLLGQAATGTGKTAAFALPMLHGLTPRGRGSAPLCLVLAPTRELAMQVSEATHRYGRDLFGAGTAWIEPPQPLDFRLLGLDRRRAYVVTLGEGDDGTTVADARADAECQLVLWDSRNRDWPADGPEDRPGTSPGDLDLLDRERSDDPGRPRLRYLDREFGIHTRLCG